MRPFVVIATKGRAKETLRLMDCLAQQTLPPAYTVVAGTEASDIEGINEHPWIASGHGEAIVASRTGSSAQRNVGLETLEAKGFFAPEAGRFFVAFFDDDFRMADDWLENARKRILKGDVAGLTGWVFADGARTGLTGQVYDKGQQAGALTEEIAQDFLSGKRPPLPHWASGEKEREIPSVYGCNMAFLDHVIRQTRFDENVPLYGWLEDRDFCSQAKKFGRILYYPDCKGVHLGTKSGGRANGLRFGYSQIMNMAYFVKKGTISPKIGTVFIARGLASNSIQSLFDNPFTDYRGRLRGNLMAIADVLRGRIDPKRILRL